MVNQICRFVLFSSVGFALSVSPVLAAKPGKGPQPVIISPVTVEFISDRIEALGTAKANEAVNITATITEKISAIRFEDGQKINKGDILAVLEQAEELANLQQAKAVLSERQLALNRLLRLEKRKLAATDDLDRTRLEVTQAKANILALQARIDDRIIRAPFSGLIGLRNISVGALVESGDLITTLDDISTIKLDFTIPAIYLPELKKGLKIKAYSSALGKVEYEGEISSIDTRIDPVSRSVKVRALLPNPDSEINPGKLLQIDLLRNTREALLIPEAALLPEGDKQFVMVTVKKEGADSVAKRQLEIGTRLPGKVEVLSGLTAGEFVVTHGNTKIKPGGSIKILAVDDGSVDIATILKGKVGKGPKQ
jgi:membrane fusion protein (multidrug efflux system)